MNNKDKHIDNIEFDDMNIKTHLNTSLDLNGISVSEDLINRTLEAIKQQATQAPAEEKGKESIDKMKKVVTWNKYIRGIAGVAAAVVIMIGGYNLISNGNAKNAKYSADSLVEDFGAKQKAETTESADAKDSSTSMTSQAIEDEANQRKEVPDSATGDMGIAAITENDTTEVATASQFTIEAGALPEDLGESTTMGTSDVNTKIAATYDDNYGFAASAPSEEEASDTGRAEILSFRTIFLSDPEQVEYVAITDNVNNISVTLTGQSDILEFYSVMDKHQFTYDTETTEGQSYTVEISNPESNTTYLKKVGEQIVVNYSDKDSTSQSIYNVLDSTLLIQDLQDLIHKYN